MRDLREMTFEEIETYVERLESENKRLSNPTFFGYEVKDLILIKELLNKHNFTVEDLRDTKKIIKAVYDEINDIQKAAFERVSVDSIRSLEKSFGESGYIKRLEEE